jgi:FkbM family methyltransferase
MDHTPVLRRYWAAMLNVSRFLARRARTAAHALGLDLVRSAASERNRLLRGAGVDLVLDVGANSGQYGEELRRAGYAGRIVSFEPLSTPFAALERRCGRDRAWQAVRVALGREAGTAAIHVSRNSVSSSLLPILPRCVESAPEAAYETTEEVEVETLAWALERFRGDAARVFVKLDVQGYERAVLDGAGDALEGVTGIQLEGSLVPLYDGETLFIELAQLLGSRGFDLVRLDPEFTDSRTRQLLQVNGLFLRARSGDGPVTRR